VSGKPRFPLVENLPSRKRGDVGARLHGMNVDSFTYSATQTGFAKSDLQPFLKDFNQWILCTYPSPTPGATVSGTWLGTPCTRTTAGANEWQGTAGPMIESWYGGNGTNGMPNATFADTYVPAGWNTNTGIPGTTFTDTALYQNVVEPYCRTCHILRGTKNQDDLDFMKLGVPAVGVTPATGFLSFADRIKVHVFDRGNMPLAQIPHSDFWSSSAPQMLASFIDGQLGVGTATSGGSVLMPGRAIADPGPDRMVRTGANAVLTGENSLFASTFSWTNVSGPSNPLITNATQMVAIFNASVAGTYVVRLTVNGGTASKDVTITVDDNFPDPLNIKFAQVKNVLQNIQYNGTTRCTNCHVSPTVSPTPPIFYNSFDRDGSLAVDATDEAWFLKALGGRVNLTEISASPLLRKPTGNHHNGGTLLSLADTSSGGGLSNYSILYNWVLGGMQPGGTAASLLTTSSGLPGPFTFTFSGPFGGPYTSPNIDLDGTSSLAATSFQWSVVPPVGVLAPSIANPFASTTTLNVFDVGTYTVRLQVSNGVDTDTMQRTIVVSENPISASFTPPTGTTAITFAGNPSRGDITLASTSSGSPISCQWQILSGPPGALLDGFVSTIVTAPCSAPATLNVPFSATQGSPATPYQIQLTASTVNGSTSSIHNITVGNGTPVVSNIVANGGARSFTGGNPANGTAATASVSLNSTGSSGVQPLTFAWSILSEPDSTNGPASLSSTTAAAPTLTVRATGSYTVRLQVTDAASNTAATTSTFSVTPANGTTFATMTGLFSSLTCTGCHFGGGVNPANNSGTAPDWTTTIGSDGSTLWRRVFQRVVVGNPAGSLLLQNPSNTDPHGGGCRPGFGCDATGSANATTFSHWITDGGPPGN
jgi:hypothetical protein